MHTYRWDLDRTYLETEIHSTRGLVRAAVETAEQKRTVPGAAALVRGLLAHSPDAELFVLSGSPRQMRAVLSEKLALDGVRPARLVLKNNLGNLLRGRMSALRNQLAYKLPELLADRCAQPADRHETLFGDDSEVDAVVYAVYAELVAGRMDQDQLVTLLRREGAYPDDVDRAVAALAALDRSDAVDDIFIRLDRGVPTATFAQYLGRRVHAVFSWWQAALLLVARDRLAPESLHDVAGACGLDDPRAVAGLAQDAVRRGIIAESAALAALDASGDPPTVDRVGRAMRALGGWRVPLTDRLDHFGFLGAVEGLSP